MIARYFERIEIVVRLAGISKNQLLFEFLKGIANYSLKETSYFYC